MSASAFRVGTRRETADGLEVAVTFPVDCPWFAGHFPGRPILPGVAHLHLACHLAGAPGGPPAAPAIVEAWRWSGQVAPGEELVASLAPASEGRSRFTLRRAAGPAAGEGSGGGTTAVVSSGTLAWAASSSTTTAGGELDGAEPRGGPAEASAGRPLADLLPHRPPARLAEELLDSGPDRLVCRGRVGADHPAVSLLGAPSFLALELAAQAGAGWAVPASAGGAAGGGGAADGGVTVDGPRGPDPAAPPVGYLVRVRGARLARSWLAPAAPLTAHLEREARSGPLTLCRFRVEDAAGAEVATGSLGIFQAAPQ